MIEIQVYEPQRDAHRIYTLWQNTLGYIWPLSYEVFDAVTVANPAYRPRDHFIAVDNGEIIGWVATQVHQEPLSSEGYLMLLLVAPTYQRQGLGSMLHKHALSSLKQRGVTQIQLGGGFYSLWQGVPTNLPDAWPFFQACGWKNGHASSIFSEIWKTILPLQISTNIFSQRLLLHKQSLPTLMLSWHLKNTIFPNG